MAWQETKKIANPNLLLDVKTSDNSFAVSLSIDVAHTKEQRKTFVDSLFALLDAAIIIAKKREE